MSLARASERALQLARSALHCSSDEISLNSGLPGLRATVTMARVGYLSGHFAVVSGRSPDDAHHSWRHTIDGANQLVLSSPSSSRPEFVAVVEPRNRK
jgi:hypothetical protein